ncbi:MAG TPA: hypothetical protein PKC05_03325 [Candidatus Saccharibacteria bacterium]|nr:hypothetical protein [Candidatus Saccharibacteria bacterium]
MRTAVLVVNYITIGLIVLAVMGLSSNGEPVEENIQAFMGLMYLMPALILSVVYAHLNYKDKK